MPVTLQQIADQAGVTRSQVSRVLNGRYKENRPAIARRAENIRQIAQNLGYRPNLAARSVTTGHFGQLAFVTCGDLGFDWFPPELLHGVHEASEKHGQRLMVSEMSAEQLADADNLPRLFRESSVDGMLINLDGKLSGGELEAFDALPVPIVLLNQKRNTRCVYPDEIAGGRAAATHLLDEGRRQIAFACLPPEHISPHYSRFDRVAGMKSALDEAGVTPVCIFEGDESYRGGLGNGPAIMGDLLLKYNSLDAIICYSMFEALAVSMAAARMGLRVPDDVRIIVFNHRLAHAQTGIPVDTLLVPFQEVGQHAVQMLHGMINGELDQRAPHQAVAYQQLYTADTQTLKPLVDDASEVSA